MKTKLISGIFILSMFIACQKDKKVDQQNSNTTNKSTSSDKKDETKKEESSIFGDILNNEEKKTAFVKQENGKNIFEFNLEKGKNYPYNIREVEEQKLSSNEKSESVINESFDELNFLVQDIKNDKYQVLVSFKSKKVTIKAQGKTLSVDTNKPVPTDKNMAQTHKLYSSLVGNSFTMEIDKQGKVSNIKGMDKIYEKVNSTLKKEVKAEELKMILEGVKASLNPEVFTKQFEAILINFPKDGVQQGEKWKNKPKTSLTEINYILTKLDENEAEIKISSFMKPESQKETKNGVTMSANMKGNQEGILKLDANSGWLKSGKIITTMIQSQKISDATKSQEMSKQVTNTTFINQ